MSSLPTPNFIITEDHTYGEDSSRWSMESKILPKDSFVRPIDILYVPKHVKEKWVGVNLKTHVYCYTRAGIMPIPRNIITQV